QRRREAAAKFARSIRPWRSVSSWQSGENSKAASYWTRSQSGCGTAYFAAGGSVGRTALLPFFGASSASMMVSPACDEWRRKRASLRASSVILGRVRGVACEHMLHDQVPVAFGLRGLLVHPGSGGGVSLGPLPDSQLAGQDRPLPEGTDCRPQ